MTDLLLQIGISNLCISLAVAIVAWTVQTIGKRPLVAHLLWLLVLGKLVTPPLLTVPLVAVPGLSAPIEETLTDQSVRGPTSSSIVAANLDDDGAAAALDAELTGAASLRTATASSSLERGKTVLILLWLLGSACVLAWSLVRIARFNRLLGMATEVAPPELQRLASEIAERLGLPTPPTIFSTSAHLSPMVWWIGGRVRVVIPAGLPQEMDAGRFRWVLAHELAHVRRRDHLVRWLEWLACVGFWWNPLTWWARRNLRVNEEFCCDALVLSSLKPNPRTYANSLLAVVEFLASPALRPPAMASEINSGRFLERRFKMIVSTNSIATTSRWLYAGILLGALGLMPLGVAYAQSPGDEAISEPRQDPGIEGHFNKIGVTDGVLARIKNHLKENDFSDQQVEEALGGMIRVVLEIRSEGEDFELDPRLEGYFLDRVGLTDEQIDLVVGLSQRIALGAKKRTGTAIPQGYFERIKPILVENGFTGAQIKMVFGLMKKVVPTIQSQGEEFEMGPRLESYLVNEVGLSDEQIDLFLRVSQRIAGGLKKKKAAAIPQRYFERIKPVLAENGFSDDQIKKVFGLMKRIVPAIQSEGEKFEMGPRLENYLVNEVGLSDEQIDLFLRVSQRIAGGLKREKDTGIQGFLHRIQPRLEESGLTDAQVKQVFRAMHRLVPAIQADGEDFELDPRMEDYLVNEIGLTDEQIDLVLGLAHRIALGMKERRAGIDLRRVWAELQARVKAGKLTEEQARAKMAAMKKKVRLTGDRAAEYRAIEARVHAAVEAGEMSREEAEQTLVAARKRIFEDGRSSGEPQESRRDRR